MKKHLCRNDDKRSSLSTIVATFNFKDAQCRQLYERDPIEITLGFSKHRIHPSNALTDLNKTRLPEKAIIRNHSSKAIDY